MKNSLEIMFPEVAKQWSTRNFPLLPKDVSYGSNKKVPYSTDDKVDNPVSCTQQPRSLMS